MKKKKIFIIVAIVLVVLSAILIILDVLKNAYLSILITPIDSTIYVNGHEYKNGTYRFFPGEVKIEIKHPEMNSRELTLQLSSHHTETLYIYLTNEGDDQFSYYEKNLADYEVLKLINNDSDSDKFITTMEDRLSIRDALPMSTFSANAVPSPVNGMLGRETIISDGTSEEGCEFLICLKLIDNTGNLNAATELLKSYGYDINNYQVIQE